jgi:hypothetical protein
MGPEDVFGLKGLEDPQKALDYIETHAADMAQDVAVLLADMVIETAYPLVPQVSGDAASSLGAYATNEGAIAVGGQGVAYYRWLEYGGPSGKDGSNFRDEIEEGRYLGPAYISLGEDVQTAMVSGLEELVQKAGLELE